MKKLMIIFSLLLIGMISANAQQFLRTYATDTVKGDTTYFPSSNSDANTLAPSYGLKSSTSTGVISFTFTHTDIDDQLNFAGLEGSNNATNWHVADTLTAAERTADGESVLVTSTPLSYLYYRVRLSAATGDTVKVTTPRLIYKEK